MIEASTLTDLLKATIHQSGPMPFSTYMQQCLYAPGHGYYVAGLQKFGARGDFTTAPEISPLFAQCLSRYCQRVCASESVDCVLEFGPGQGTLCKDILLSWEQSGKPLPTHYYLLELSAELKARQHQLLTKEAPHLLSRVTWLTVMPTKFSGVIIANEVIDAMPVEWVRYAIPRTVSHDASAGWQRGFVSLSDTDDLQLQWQPVEAGSQLAARCQAIESVLDVGQLEQDYVTEVNLLADGWVGSLADSLQQGAAVLIDYGYDRQQYYSADRCMGTLMCHHQQRAHADPFHLPGEQDITAHVDFTQVGEVAEAQGMQVTCYDTQANFLLAEGITDYLPPVSDAFAYLQATTAVKVLTMPHEMGELFKVMCLSPRKSLNNQTNHSHCQ